MGREGLGYLRLVARFGLAGLVSSLVPRPRLLSISTGGALVREAKGSQPGCLGPIGFLGGLVFLHRGGGVRVP
jgi:hypothetical protein